MNNKLITYKKSGVNINAADKFVNFISSVSSKKRGKKKFSNIGGFGSISDIPNQIKQPKIVACTDGVGTKIMLYNDYKNEEGISINNLGIDLVGMVLNDIVCTGAKPIFFNDYLSVNNIEGIDALGLIDGINEGLKQCGNVPFLGGETAIMSDMYKSNEFDIAGFGVGVCPKEHFIDGSNISEGNVMIGLKSDGFHSNGYTLIRKVLEENPFDMSILKDLLTPTRLYVEPILKVLSKYRNGVNGIAHITGGGRSNVDRLMGEDMNLRPKWFDENHLTDEMKFIQKAGSISDIEMRRVFNNGIGMVLVVTKEVAGDIILLLEAMGESPIQVGLIESRLSGEYNDSLKG